MFNRFFAHNFSLHLTLFSPKFNFYFSKKKKKKKSFSSFFVQSMVVITETNIPAFLCDSLARCIILGHELFLAILWGCYSIAAIKKYVVSLIIISLQIICHLSLYITCLWNSTVLCLGVGFILIISLEAYFDS